MRAWLIACLCVIVIVLGAGLALAAAPVKPLPPPPPPTPATVPCIVTPTNAGPVYSCPPGYHMEWEWGWPLCVKN